MQRDARFFSRTSELSGARDRCQCTNATGLADAPVFVRSLERPWIRTGPRSAANHPVAKPKSTWFVAQENQGAVAGPELRLDSPIISRENSAVNDAWDCA